MLTVRSLMTTSPDSISPDASLHSAIRKMNNDGCRQLPVVANTKLIGIITDRDVRLAINSPLLPEDEALDRSEILDQLTVNDCMTGDPMTVSPEDSAHAVADILSLYKINALPVVMDGQLVGVISVIDYLKHFAAQGAG